MVRNSPSIFPETFIPERESDVIREHPEFHSQFKRLCTLCSEESFNFNQVNGEKSFGKNLVLMTALSLETGFTDKFSSFMLDLYKNRPELDYMRDTMMFFYNPKRGVSLLKLLQEKLPNIDIFFGRFFFLMKEEMGTQEDKRANTFFKACFYSRGSRSPFLAREENLDEEMATYLLGFMETQMQDDHGYDLFSSYLTHEYIMILRGVTHDEVLFQKAISIHPRWKIAEKDDETFWKHLVEQLFEEYPDNRETFKMLLLA
jgi:hypothetical protein